MCSGGALENIVKKIDIIYIKMMIALTLILLLDQLLFHSSLFSRAYYGVIVVLYSYISVGSLHSLKIAKERVIYSLIAVFVGMIALGLSHNISVIAYIIGAFVLSFLAIKYSSPILKRGLPLYGVVIVEHNIFYNPGQPFWAFFLNRSVQTLLGVAVVIFVEIIALYLYRMYQKKSPIRLKTLIKISNPKVVKLRKKSFVESLKTLLRDKNFIFLIIVVILLYCILEGVFKMDYLVFGVSLIFAPRLSKLNYKEFYKASHKYLNSIIISIIPLVIIYFTFLHHWNVILLTLIGSSIIYFLPYVIPYFTHEDKRLGYRIFVIYLLQGYAIDYGFHLASNWLLGLLSIFILVFILITLYIVSTLFFKKTLTFIK